MSKPIMVRHWFLEAPICRACGEHVPVYRKPDHWLRGDPVQPEIPFRFTGFGVCPRCQAVFEVAYGLN